MTRDEIEKALRSFGERCGECECVVIGGAAAILSHWLVRVTGDIDVIHSRPKLSTLAEEIKAVADEMGLPEGWLNDGASAWNDVLPPDYEGRLMTIDVYGKLKVMVVGRKDFILLKLFSLRPEDLDDLREIDPTEEEIAFVRSQLERIARFNAPKAHRIELYLQQKII